MASSLERVDLAREKVLSNPDQSFEHAYFIESGICSIVVTSPKRHRAETGLVGLDGFTPVGAALGVDRSPQGAIMQVGGTAIRLDIGTLARRVDDDPVLRRVLLLFAHAFSVQSAYTAFSNAVHVIEERLARWLLMCHDRMDGDVMPLTHNFLAIMLAVRRPSVTTALHVLEGHRFITADRGRIVLRDREALEAFAGDAYGRPEAEYARVFGGFGNRRVAPAPLPGSINLD